MPEAIPFPTRPTPTAPPDDAERRRALDPTRSFLVQAPAGSGKTHLLTQRFLRLLAQAQRPDEIVAITFTLAAAAEMRNRILEALEKAEALEKIEGSETAHPPVEDPLSIPALARSALIHSRRMHWQLLEQPGQLRILTIDAFCRSLAMQAPLNWGLLSGLASLETTDQPEELYRRAARRLFERVIPSHSPSLARTALESLLLWRDNNWRDVETQIVEMLAQRNRWYHDFVFSSNINFPQLRQRLEAPMRRAAHQALADLSSALHSFPEASNDLLSIARIACGNCENPLLASIAERPEIPHIRLEEILDSQELEDAASAFRDLATFLLTKTEKSWRKRFDISLGFPPGAPGKPLKTRIESLLNQFREHPTLESALCTFLNPIPTAYTEDEWTLIRHAFVVLSQAWAELQLLFAETGQVDFTEIAQIALRILTPPEEASPDFSPDFNPDPASRIAEGIHHLLIDEFQDTSRNQHQLLSRLIAAWPDTIGRTCFCVGDPMQSIYGFRDADVELFEQLKLDGLPLPGHSEPFHFDFAALQANFRTTPTLVRDLNQHFSQILPKEENKTGPDDVAFAPATPVRPQNSTARTELHLDFTLAPRADATNNPTSTPETTRQSQLDRIVTLIRHHLLQAESTLHANPQAKYRIAVLGRTRTALVRVAEALRTAEIPFRAINLVPLRERPEILDALALARASLNPSDRRAWLGILRAPWCGLSLAELHALTSADDANLLTTPIPTLLQTRLPALARSGVPNDRSSSLGWQSGHLGPASAAAAARLARTLSEAQSRRAESATVALGTWLESLWKALGGPATVNQEAQANLRLLWTTLDQLPSAEAGLLSSELDNALDGLYALPDPAASSDHGVQLMTIHQSKGLEFEIVLLPELESSTRSTTPTMISWLERGLPASGLPSQASSETQGPTEFLIAPIQSKGSEAGQAKQWVDGIRKERETRERRRLLYVAATRAREELHLFARPAFNPGKTGQPTLGQPTLSKPSGLLQTAWPAFSSQIEAQFQSEFLPQAQSQTTSPLALAAQADLFPTPKPTRLYRLPAGFTPADSLFSQTNPATSETANLTGSLDFASTDSAYQRTAGSLYSRLHGTAIHAFLEELTFLRQSLSPKAASEALDSALPGITTLLRGRGLAPSTAAALARESLVLARQVLTHPVGSWLLTPHPQSSTEARWSGVISATLHHLRPDRVFLAPPQTREHASETSPNAPEAPQIWWIIDYKTAHLPANQVSETAARQQFLETHRAQHAAQLHAYAQLLRGLTTNSPVTEIRAGLFYPRLLLFDSWPL